MARPMADHKPRLTSDGRLLVTVRFLEFTTHRHRRVIQRKAAPVACDVRTRTLLYDVDEIGEALNPRRVA